MSDFIGSFGRFFFKWAFLFLLVFAIVTAVVYAFADPKQQRDWTPAHSRLANIEFTGDNKNPTIKIQNLRDFAWQRKSPEHYSSIEFMLKDIVELKAGVSHFSSISEIAHVFMIFVLEDGREIGVSIEARREKDEEFSIKGGLLAHFELIYVLATAEDLLGVRLLNQEAVHVYPIKETRGKARELFLLIANEIKALHKKPSLYHLFFKNCTNQLVKHVSILTQRKYPWYFQTLAPGLTGRTLYELDLIDLPPHMTFKEVQAATKITIQNRK